MKPPARTRAQLRMTRRLALGGLGSLLASTPAFAGGAGRLHFGRPPLEPATLASSITHVANGNTVTWGFNKPMPTGRFRDDRPWVVRPLDGSGALTDDLPHCVAIAAANWTDTNGGLQTGRSLIANGVMIDPYLAASGGYDPQGFDEMLSTNPTSLNKQAAVTAYDGAKNASPSKPGGAPLVFDRAMALVKPVRTKATPDGSFTTFESWHGLYVLDAVPPLGAYGPGVSDLDKTVYATTANANFACLGSGFTRSAGMPDHTTCVSEGYFLGLQPFFGQQGEAKRKYVVNPKTAATSGGGDYSRDYSQHWSDAFAAVLAQGTAADPVLRDRCAQFGLDLIGLYNRGDRGGHGAGQWLGYKQFIMFAGFLFWPTEPGIMAKALGYVANETHQQFWCPDYYEGINTFWSPPTGVSLRELCRQTAFAEHVGLPLWMSFLGATASVPSDCPRPPPAKLMIDTAGGADYEYTSGVGAFGGITNICLLKNGPNGWDGTQVLNNHADWSVRAEQGASVAYMHRQRTFTTSNLDFSNVASIIPTRHQAHYDDHHGGMALQWTGPPEAAIPSYNQSNGDDKFLNWVTASAGGFSWDLTNLNQYTDPAILEYRLWYSLDGNQLIPVTSPTVANSQTGLANAQLYHVYWQRRSASGWSPRSSSFKRASTDSKARMTIVTGGVAGGTPTWTVAPKLLISKYPRWKGPYCIDAPSPLDLDVTVNLIAGVGSLTGDLSGGFTFAWERDANGGAPAAISGAASATYTVTLADQSTPGVVRRVRAVITCGGVNNQTNWVEIPERAALAGNVYMQTDFGAAKAGLDYAEQIASAVANSVHNNNVSLPLTIVFDPNAVATNTVGEDVTVVASGLLYGSKNGQRPEIRMNATARKPTPTSQLVSMRLIVALGATGRTASANLKVKVGSTEDGAEYFAEVIVPFAGSPKEVEVSIPNFTTTGPDVWVTVLSDSATGGITGGDPAISYIELLNFP